MFFGFYSIGITALFPLLGVLGWYMITYNNKFCKNVTFSDWKWFAGIKINQNTI